MLKKFLRTSDLAREAGVSVQTIRSYEECGFLLPAERTSSGYRLYTPGHLHALKVARGAIAGYGWQRALLIMQFIHKGDLPSALAVIDARHAEIHHSRREIEETLSILRTASISLPKMEQSSRQRSGLQVHEAAKSVGVRTSTVRYWEERGLLQPQRDHTSRYRIYDEVQLRKLQVVALLRKANYDFEAIQAVLDQLATGTPEQALAAAEHRLKELAEVSRRCMKAAAMLWEYLAGDAVPG